MLTIDIHALYKETEKDIMSFPFSIALKAKLNGNISSIEEIEDLKIFQIQRECKVKFTAKERQELQREIDKFRETEIELSKKVNEKDVVSNMLNFVKGYFIDKYSESFMRYIETDSGPVVEFGSLIYNLSILEGRRSLRAILRVNGFSEEEIAFTMCNYALCRVVY